MVHELVHELRALGVRLTTDGEELKCLAPPGVLAPDVVGKIRNFKRELIEFLSATSDAKHLEAVPIRRVERTGSSPLSLAQRQLWLMDALAPGTSVLNVASALDIRGPLDLDVLGCALSEVVARHDTLRTTIITTDSGPEQLVHPGMNVSLEVSDRTPKSGSAAMKAVRQFIAPRLAEPFAHETGPLIRAGVVKRGAERFLFWVAVSRLVSDGWSFDVFFSELAALYSALALGRSSPLPPLPVQYGDYVEWHTRALAEESADRDVAYWKERLRGIPEGLELPFDHPRPPRMSHRGAVVPFELPRETTSKLRELGRTEGATMHMVLLAAVKLALHRYTGERDLVVGAPVAGRVRPETERLIGVFVNTVVLRTTIDEDWTFPELIRAVKETCLDAYEHQHAPLERVAAAVSTVRDRSRTELFQVLFSYRTSGEGPVEMASLDVSPVSVDAGGSVTDLAFYLADDGVDVSCELEYALDLFERETVSRVATYTLDLLAEIARAPRAKLRDLDGIGAHRATLESCNRSEARPEDSRLLHRLFEEQAVRTPHAVAIRFEDESITYRELAARVNRFARHLRALGVERDSRVGIRLPRSIDMVVAMLAVHTAGGAYLPLDPSYPAERLSYVLGDSGAGWVICEESTATQGGSDDVVEIVLPHVQAAVAAETPEPLGIDESPEQLAYVIYTSGSTGKPKGVLVEHRSAAVFLRAMSERIDLTPGGVWLAGTSISFDISVLEIFGSLVHGLTVVLLGDMKLGAVSAAQYGIAPQILRHRVTHFQCTPSQAALLLEDEAVRAALGRLRQFLLGGEALPEHLAKRLLDLVPGRLFNVYGPTETTVWSSTHEVRDVSGPVPIGRPIEGTRFYVLDSRLRMRPIGASGELYIAGAGVARGYHDRPELTKERFLPDPFRPGARMYKTGDLVRYRVDGAVEFLGRNDQQVKIRGHRIELGEIESLLGSHPAVKEVVVTTYVDAFMGQSLAAYVVSHSARQVEPAELRDFLKRHVPAPAVPAAFIELGRLPLTPNGKIDRALLPPPDGTTSPAKGREPKDDVERRLLEIWRSSLGVPGIGVDGDFFELGGHSILGVRLLSRVHQEFGVELSLGAFFEAPNVGAMADRIRRDLPAATSKARGGARRARAPSAWNTVVPIQPHGSLPPLFCVAGSGGNPMNLVHVARYLGADQPFYGLQHRGVDGRHGPHSSVQEMAREFLSHIRRIQPQGPYFLSGFSGGGTAAFEMAMQLRASNEAVKLLLLLESNSPNLPGWSLGERLHYHTRRFANQGASYLGSAISNGILRRVEHFRLRLCWHAAKIFPYEFRNEVVERAWMTMEERYRPRPYPGTVFLLRSRERDTLVFDASNGWRSTVLGEVVVLDVDGGHTSFVSEPHAKLTAKRIAEVLALARGERSGVRAAPPPASRTAFSVREVSASSR